MKRSISLLASIALLAIASTLTTDASAGPCAGNTAPQVNGHLKYNLETQSLPTTTQCYILRVTVTDTSTGDEKSEEVLLQAK